MEALRMELNRLLVPERRIPDGRRSGNDRRTGIDRRVFAYAIHVPERRMGNRRGGLDRRDL